MATNLRETILGLLLDRPNHAYALKQLLGPRVSPAAEGGAAPPQVNDGVLYPLLARLEREGLIEGRTETGPRNRQRTIFTVTTAGQAAFMDWLASPADEGTEPLYDFLLGHPLLAKVQFFARLPAKARAAKLQAQVERIDAKLVLFAEIRGGMLARKADRFRIALLDLGIAQQKATRRWLKGLLKG